MGKKDKASAEDELYHVEVITKARVTAVSDDEDDEQDDRTKKKRKKKNMVKTARWEYYVKWANYDSDANSWEPEENVAGCQRLLASFWAHIGTDDDDYPIGYVVEAREDWIKREKVHFKTEFDEAQQKLRAERERVERDRAKKMKKKLKKTLRDASPEMSSSKNSLSKQKVSKSGKNLDGVRAILKRKRQAGDSDNEGTSTPRKSTRTDTSSRVRHDQEKQSEQVDSWAESLFSEPPSSEQPIAPSQSPQLLQAPPKPLLQPKVQLPRRPGNPHAKVMEMAPPNVSSASGIPTKQRLSLGALAPTRPNAIPTPTPRERPPVLPPVRTNSSTLISLSFKKKLPLPPSSGNGGNDFFSVDDTNAPTGPPTFEQRDGNTPVSSPTVQFTPPSQTLVVSPMVSTMHEDPTFLSSPVLVQSPAETSYSKQAETFLQAIMPPALAAPLNAVIEAPPECLPPRPVVTKQVKLPQTIPKAWSWSGGIYLLSAPFCNVTFCDVSNPSPTGIRFGVALDPLDRLEFSTFHDMVDLPVILQACGLPQQFARITPKDDNDIGNFEVFQTYMTKHRKVILVPISLDEQIIGHIFIFPENRALCDRLKIPVTARTSDMLTFLIAALLPWSLSPSQIARRSRLPPGVYLPVNTDIESTLDQIRWERSIRLKPVYHHALRILRFPIVLHKFMSEPNHSFSVWWDGGDGSKKKAGIETHMLFSIMEQCRAKKLPCEPRGTGDPRAASDPRITNDPRVNAEPRVMFVHVGAVKSLRNLPGLLEFCSKSLTQFWTYGTHRTIEPEYWGVREIYPCGGIVTFTPEAILDDYLEVLAKINQIQSHPLWACYILPSVLGMVAKDEEDDPVAGFDSGKFPFTGLLKAIDEGHLALLTAPPLGRVFTERGNSREGWLRNHWAHRPVDTRSTLQFCTNALNSKHANMQNKELASAIKTEISDDLCCMRQQPVLMAEYRRYVVFSTAKERRARRDDGLEWTTAKEFDFKDNYFVE